MSNIILLSLLSLGVMVSFSFIYSVKQKIDFVEYTEMKGSENSITKEIEVGTFHSISSHDQIRVILQSGEPSVEISAEDNLIDFLKVENEDGTLQIYMDAPRNKGVQQYQPMIVRISNPQYKSIVAQNQSEVLISGEMDFDVLTISLKEQSFFKGMLNAKLLKVETNQQSRFSASGTADDIELIMRDQSEYDGIELIAKKVYVEQNQQTKSKMHATDQIDGSIQGNARISLNGSPIKNQLNIGSMARVTN